MPSVDVTTTDVVNTKVMLSAVPWQNVPMSATNLPTTPRLLDRLRYVVESGRVKSAREWCKLASISPSYLGTVMSRLRAGTQDSIGADEAAALAKAVDVPVHWLMFGESPASEPSTTSQPATVVESPDRYPQVTEFVAVMLEHGATEDEAARFRSRVALLKSVEGPSVDDLAELWRTMQREHRSMVEHATKIYQRAPVKDGDPFGAPRGPTRGGAKGRR